MVKLYFRMFSNDHKMGVWTCDCDGVRQQRIQFLVPSRDVIGKIRSIFVILFIFMQKFELMLKICRKKSVVQNVKTYHTNKTIKNFQP